MNAFGRRVLVSLGQSGANGVSLPGLRTSFEVRMSRAGAPNQARVRVWNTGTTTAAALVGPAPTCMVAAGLGEGAPSPIFRGDVVTKQLVKSGTDRVLDIEAQDGGRVWTFGRTHYTTTAPTSLVALVQIAVSQQGLPIGDLTPGADVPQPRGAYINEPFRDFMDRASASLRATWTVTDGFFYLTPKGAPGPSPTMPRFSAVGGTLVGQPVSRERNQVEIVGLLDPTVRPGRLFSVDSPTVRGTFIADEVTFRGDSGYEQPFFVEVKGKLWGAS